MNTPPLQGPPPPTLQQPTKSVPTEERKWPNVSVIIITKGRHTQAEAAVASVLADDYPAHCREVLVIEETSRPFPITGPGVRYHALPEENRGFPFARNEGVRLALHDVIAFTDDDCLVERGWLKALVSGLLQTPPPGQDPVVAVAGAVRVPPCGPIGECESILGFPGGGVKYLYQLGGSPSDVSTFSTCNCALRRSDLLATGGFDETLRHGGEDERLARRLSATGRIVYHPAAVVRHTPRDSIPGIWRWFVRRGQARADALRSDSTAWRHTPELLRNSPFVRLATASLVLGALFGWFAIPTLIALLLLHAGFILWRFRWSSRYYPGWCTRLCLPMVKLIMDMAYDWGLARGLWRSKRSRI